MSSSPEWSWDAIRNQYYYFHDGVYIFQDGQRFRPSSTSNSHEPGHGAHSSAFVKSSPAARNALWYTSPVQSSDDEHFVQPSTKFYGTPRPPLYSDKATSASAGAYSFDTLQAVLNDVEQNHPYLDDRHDKPAVLKAFSAISVSNITTIIFRGCSQVDSNTLRALPDTGCDANFISREKLESSWGVQATDRYNGADFATFSGLNIRPSHEIYLQFNLDHGSHDFTQRFLVIPRKLMPSNYHVVLCSGFLFATGIFKKDASAVDQPDGDYIEDGVEGVDLRAAYPGTYSLNPRKSKRKSSPIN
ncbi:hypothetical protein EJ08DRAFT_729828 [Tothia fuscella]|uniref:Uncharacterized protein n=1 Tax=Tothia fuscella TaxID=1048955 RepID=A0A9P4P278_9PEZI|nr:hypothetical protein EJ08DRAFT_729828 [Tothia fuscella]